LPPGGSSGPFGSRGAKETKAGWYQQNKAAIATKRGIAKAVPTKHGFRSHCQCTGGLRGNPPPKPGSANRSNEQVSTSELKRNFGLDQGHLESQAKLLVEKSLERAANKARKKARCV
jgi:hypothetical protein